MPKYYTPAAIICLCFIFLFGCQEKSGNTEDIEKNEATKVENEDDSTSDLATEEEKVQQEDPFTLDAPKMPNGLEEVVAYPVGLFASKDTKVKDEAVQAALEAIPPLSENASEEELSNLLDYMYSLFKMDYDDPKVIIDSLSIATTPDSEEISKEEQTETFNVEIILDASGSMKKMIGSKSMMETAKEAIKEFASSLPEQANVGLRVYGHKGTGSNADKAMSCAANELIYPIQPYSESGLSEALGKFNPAGWTPLAQSLLEAQQDLSQYKGENHRNIIYLVSDGVETCDGDPIAAAKSLKESEISPVVNIIGFDLDTKDEQQLKAVAEVAGGTYVNVRNQEQLKSQFNQASADAYKWMTWYQKEQSGIFKNADKQKTSIYKLSNSWKNNISKEKYLISFSLQSLYTKKKITKEQELTTYKMAEEFYDLHYGLVEEMKNTLIDARDENLSSSLAEIKEIYNKNVSQGKIE
ncbi:VWA domain-containing protein [Bacillus sp. FJAT-49705]|uniref:VWA domain-containing protein n=1 Tax=Cytobacillus citreus TaxID=2833586 RepID=A0ABS5NZK8_9BACI|nr:VWA domain-containing protein [Cytobacillus citreus]MBS4193291.1 VWA domain-containing protein [Cytobacillus citreus]